MKILFLSDNFPPEVNAPASRTFEHSRQWIKMGHEVTVITCAPNFPNGKVFEGYRNALRSIEICSGIKVVRVKTYIAPNEKFIKRTFDYLSFAFSAVIAGVLEKKPDVIVATSPQFFAALAGLLLSWLKRTPFVLEVRDLWPESIVAVGAMKRGVLFQVLSSIELFLYRNASAIVVVSNSFKNEMIQRGIDGAKIALIQNGVDDNFRRQLELAEKNCKKRHKSDTFLVGYLGTHGMAQGLETVVQAAKLLQEVGEKDVNFLFVGEGAEKRSLIALAKRFGLKNLEFKENQDRALIPKFYCDLDLMVVPLLDRDTFRSVIPSKIFECMCAGTPILASVPRGEASKIILDRKIGIHIPPERPDLIVEGILSLKSQPDLLLKLSKNGKSQNKNFSRASLARRMLRVLSSV